MENVKKFFEALKTDKALAEKLKEAGKAYEGKEISEQERIDAIERELLPVIKAAGYDVTLAELEAFGQSQMPAKSELSDDELEAVAGGSGACGCIKAGGGGGKTVDEENFGCACIGYGQGGDAKTEHWLCKCVTLGTGGDEHNNCFLLGKY